jgi:ADP-heptose:LPS heptosyltransferase
MNTDSSERILIIRNDKLGDFMLAWPAFALIKNTFPESTVIALVPEYTRPMAEFCPWIDQVICDISRKNPFLDGIKLAPMIRRQAPDVSISLFSEFRTAFALWLARVPVRIAPATKISQIFHNVRIPQRRSESLKPEYEYNLDLAQHFISLLGKQAVRTCQPPYLKIDINETEQRKSDYLSKHNLDQLTRLIIIHPGTGGSATNLSLEQFASLARSISTEQKCHFIITAGPDEAEIANSLGAMMSDLSHTVHVSRDGLVAFSHFITLADLFISGSTGPLHIAGATNTPTMAFYPYKKSATSLRWQTLNTSDNRLAYSGDKHSMQSIDIKQAAADAIAFLDR